ncbi:hypothetical protein GUITHDRAFT_149720 [Guillardia theta CCMP2712]|uniref:Uncharacterized protein n=1 Tax=Guillardia theta (strain CCMP2712) TaxID=905079 RepID=L1K3W6_GUITC|nr:hypothetical protein GUITHDRAFT_149720 [Guillardia theta CCMP2712]EKX55170.1 hypothetical protein GUITHDRAFT_149720 [Guillardia theta CCMP2712]|mmetsp:Transcript_477/g.1057  ORF Transcript_477/g.1057 Transcript_477/m.1057 type:complete len:176 (-) Transcript_477:384-911(-)|eukprot:XP_005842150.1 hypothetical protein GUITHDRAFT_149720 [Guillardia theta CCMP2712]
MQGASSQSAASKLERQKRNLGIAGAKEGLLELASLTSSGMSSIREQRSKIQLASLHMRYSCENSSDRDGRSHGLLQRHCSKKSMHANETPRGINGDDRSTSYNNPMQSPLPLVQQTLPVSICISRQPTLQASDEGEHDEALCVSGTQQQLRSRRQGDEFSNSVPTCIEPRFCPIV